MKKYMFFMVGLCVFFAHTHSLKSVYGISVALAPNCCDDKVVIYATGGEAGYAIHTHYISLEQAFIVGLIVKNGAPIIDEVITKLKKRGKQLCVENLFEICLSTFCKNQSISIREGLCLFGGFFAGLLSFAAILEPRDVNKRFVVVLASGTASVLLFALLHKFGAPRPFDGANDVFRKIMSYDQALFYIKNQKEVEKLWLKVTQYLDDKQLMLQAQSFFKIA